MKFSQPVLRTVTAASVALLLSACVANTPRNESANSGAVNTDPCNMANTALAGAAAGLIIGALVGGKKGAAQGGIAGGALAAVACYTMNVQSRQTKSAAQADIDYKNARGALPSQPTVVAYTPKLENSRVQRGQKLMVNSTLELVNGTSEPIREVREELQIFNPDGTQYKTGSKPFVANSSGRFENSFELSMPAQAPQGVYALKTNVFINGKPSASRDLQTHIVWNGVEGVLVAGR